MSRLVDITLAFYVFLVPFVTGEPLKFDTSFLNHIHEIIPIYKTVNFHDAVLTNGVNLTISLPNDYALASTASWQDRSSQYLKDTLPTTLEQFNVPQSQIPGMSDRGIPLVIQMVQQIINEPHPSRLRTRNIFGDILDWAEDFGCALVSAAGFGVYMFLAADYTANNQGSDLTTTTPDQDFFVTPSHGDLAHSAPVDIYYNAEAAPYVDRYGITFNRQVYLNISQVRDLGVNNYLDFRRNVHLLIHEFTHVEQYRDRDWDIAQFGHEYTFQLCKAGFDPTALPLEQEAYGREGEVDALLVPGLPGNAFFWIWKFANLQPALGFPIARAPSSPDPNDRLIELPFQNGVLQISNPGEDTPLYRTFTNQEIALRGPANCNANPPCYDSRRRHLTRSPMPMPPDGPPQKCDKETKDALAKQCRDAKDAWNGIVVKRQWQSNVTIPKKTETPSSPGDDTPQPTPKPGCPPNCHIIQLVPISSHSCQLDNPPDGCDHEAANENNKDCHQKIAACNA